MHRRHELYAPLHIFRALLPFSAGAARDSAIRPESFGRRRGRRRFRTATPRVPCRGQYFAIRRRASRARRLIAILLLASRA